MWAAHAYALAGGMATVSPGTTPPPRRFTAANSRDRAACGRNRSIEILEFFDRVKYTRRIGDARWLQCAPHEAFGQPGA